MKSLLAAAVTLAIAAPASAQGMDPVWVGQSAVGQSNMSNARANTRRVAGANKSREATAPKSASVDMSKCRSSMTQARLESIYRGRKMLQGQAKADAWLQTECGENAGALAQSATGGAPASRDRRKVASAEGEGCRTVMRPVAGLGGVAMTMGMVTECD